METPSGSGRIPGWRQLLSRALFSCSRRCCLAVACCCAGLRLLQRRTLLLPHEALLRPLRPPSRWISRSNPPSRRLAACDTKSYCQTTAAPWRPRCAPCPCPCYCYILAHTTRARPPIASASLESQAKQNERRVTRRESQTSDERRDKREETRTRLETRDSRPETRDPRPGSLGETRRTRAERRDSGERHTLSE